MAVARYLASPMLVSVWLFSCRRVRPAADTMMRCVFGIRKAAFAAFFSNVIASGVGRTARSRSTASWARALRALRAPGSQRSAMLDSGLALRRLGPLGAFGAAAPDERTRRGEERSRGLCICLRCLASSDQRQRERAVGHRANASTVPTPFAWLPACPSFRALDQVVRAATNGGQWA